MASKYKIYFAGSIGGGRDYLENYNIIVEQLKTYGQVLTEHVAMPDAELAKVQSVFSCNKELHDQHLEWLTESDVVVAECTQPSHGVGYELGRAAHLNKKVLCLLYSNSGKHLSQLVHGAVDDERFLYKPYSKDDLPQILKAFFASL